MDVSLLIRLIDQVSAPAQKIAEKLRGISDVAGELTKGFREAVREGFSVDNVEQATRNAEVALGRARTKFIAAVGMAASMAAPIKALADYESRLVAFGNTAGILGADLVKIDNRLRSIAPTVNKSAGELLSALDYMVGKGLDPKVALDALNAVGMTSTATGADIVDMASSGFAAIDNLGIAATDLQLAYDAMAQAGKSGGFELAGMAKYFPTQTASARQLGMEGVDAVAELAAALQIAMKGTGDESVAANNMQNFLSKLTAPETVQRFKRQGIDIREEFAKAEKSGVSVFEHMLTLIDRMADGDKFKIGELFGDQQVGDFLKPMIQNLEEFRRIRDEALAAEGVNEADFRRVMETATAKVKALIVEIGNLVAEGQPLLDAFKSVADRMTEALRALNAFAAANPELARNVVTATGGLLAFNVALRTVGLAFAGVRTVLTKAAGLFLAFGPSGRNVAVGWRVLAVAGRLLMAALVGIQAVAIGMGAMFAGITAPVWGLIAVLVAAGFALWRYWYRISHFVRGFASVFRGPLERAVEAVSNALGRLASAFGIDTGKLRAIRRAIASFFDFSGFIEAAKAVLGNFWTWLGSFFSQEPDIHGTAMVALGHSLAQSLLDGFKAYIDAWIVPIRELFKFTVEIEWPEPPEWLLWLVGKARSLGTSVQGSDLWRSTGEKAGSIARDLTGAGVTVPALPLPPADGVFGQFLSGMDRAAGNAGASLEQGGKAVATGGERAGDALGAGADKIGSAAQTFLDAVTSAAGAIRSAAASAAAGGGAAGRIESGRFKALHDGVD